MFWFAIWLACLAFLLHAEPLGHQKFLELSDEDQAKLSRKHVQKVDGMFFVNIRNYKVYSDVSEKVTLEMAIMMDEFYSRFREKFKGAFQKKNIPVMYICKDKPSFEKTFQVLTGRNEPTEWAAGFYIPNKNGALIGNYEYKEGFVEVMKHEGTHQLLDYYIQAALPTWFNEGTATNFETWVTARTVQNNVLQSIHASHRPLVLTRAYPEQGYIPFEKLIHLSAKEWSDSQLPSEQYASAWVAVHYLLSTQEGQILYNKLLSAFRANQSQSKILTPLMVDKLSNQIHKHIKSVVLPFVTIIRPLERALARGEIKQARKLWASLEENPTKVFHDIWIKLLDGQDDPKFSDNLLQMRRKDFDHPQFDYVLALAYKSQGQTSKALISAKTMVAHDANHMEAKALVAALAEQVKLERDKVKKFIPP